MQKFDQINIQQAYKLETLIRRAHDTLSGLSDMQMPHRSEQHDSILKATREYLTALKRIQGM